MRAVRLLCLLRSIKKNPAASDPLLPDLQMDRAAQPSCSYKISLARRYNSFSLYMSCQINLASSGAILVLVTQSIEETTSPLCHHLSSESTWKYTCMSSAIMPPLHHDTFGKCALKSDPWSEGTRCWDDEVISGVYHYSANECLRVRGYWCMCVCALMLRGWFSVRGLIQHAHDKAC